MAEYAKVWTDGIAFGPIAEYRAFAETPQDTSRKGFVWLPVEVTNPGSDPSTQVKTGPVAAVVGDAADWANAKVTRVWTVRNKTAEELDEQKVRVIDGMDYVSLRWLFNLENRVRTLEGKQPVTLAQAKAAIKALL